MRAEEEVRDCLDAAEKMLRTAGGAIPYNLIWAEAMKWVLNDKGGK